MPKVWDMNHPTTANVDLHQGVTHSSGKMKADAQVIPSSKLLKSGRTTKGA